MLQTASQHALLLPRDSPVDRPYITDDGTLRWKLHSFLTTAFTMPQSRELPMPNVTRICSLSQAQATLLHCWTKLNKFNQEQSPSNAGSWSPGSAVNERREFRSWLDRWETAFGAFLSNAMPSMNSDDVTLSRVLKANHLACTILTAADDLRRPDAFDAECRAIIELADAVLRARYAIDSPQQKQSKSRATPTSFVPILDVKEPLLVVLSRCHQESLQIRTTDLLAAISS